MLRETDTIRDIARRATDPDAGSLRVGLFPTLAPYLLPHVVPTLHERFPKLELLLVEEKETLMQRMGQRQLRIELMQPLDGIPEALSHYDLDYSADSQTLVYSYEANGERTGIASLFADLSKAGIILRDIETKQSSLEDIFVGLVEEKA